MGSEDDDLIAMSRQASVEIDGNLITLINVDLEAVALKHLGRLLDKSLVWLEAIELVDNGCLSLTIGTGALGNH